MFGNRAAKRFKEKYREYIHVENLSDRDFEANSTVQKVKVQNESCFINQNTCKESQEWVIHINFLLL